MFFRCDFLNGCERAFTSQNAESNQTILSGMSAGEPWI